jgi:hypothetical protein
VLITKIEEWVKGFIPEAELAKNRALGNKELYAVADLQLAFDNDKMMKFLEQRANALKSGQFEKAREISEKMTAYKNDNFASLTVPKLFFCTFHHELAYSKSINKDFDLYGDVIKVRQATEPTDIMWENR